LAPRNEKQGPGLAPSQHRRCCAPRAATLRCYHSMQPWTLPPPESLTLTGAADGELVPRRAATSSAPGVISRRLCTPAGAINLAAVAAAADQHLSAATRTHEQPGWRFHRRRLARTRSAPCLPIGRLSPRQSASDARRHAARHATRLWICGQRKSVAHISTGATINNKHQFDSSEGPGLRPSPSYSGDRRSRQ
jgi:hypothetical protein